MPIIQYRAVKIVSVDGFNQKRQKFQF